MRKTGVPVRQLMAEQKSERPHPTRPIHGQSIRRGCGYDEGTGIQGILNAEPDRGPDAVSWELESKAHSDKLGPIRQSSSILFGNVLMVANSSGSLLRFQRNSSANRMGPDP